MKYLIHSLLRTDLVVSLSRFGFALLVLSCCFATTAAEAQTTEILPEKHLEFRGISLGQPRDAFADSLRTKGYEITTPQHPTSSSSVWMKGRYDSFHCLLEMSASGDTQLVDSARLLYQTLRTACSRQLLQHCRTRLCFARRAARQRQLRHSVQP